jgi:hypothetical protein
VFLELTDCFQVLLLMFMLLMHLVCFNCFLELLVFLLVLPFLKVLDLNLLLNKSVSNFWHMLISLVHLSQEIIWSTNWRFGLNKDLHSWLDILSDQVVTMWYIVNRI